jgi:diguanylate cyclase (GGDEF)-like protein
MKHRIAIVDDDPIVVSVTEAMLVDDGYEVRSAQNLTAAIELVREWTPHLVLLDYYLADDTAPDIVAAIRRFDVLVQVILVTGFAAKQPARQLLARLDIQGYHDKADSPHRLLVLVEAALKHFLALERAERQRGYLRHILNVSPQILRLQPVPDLLHAALTHVGALLQGADGFVATTNSGLFVLNESGRGVAIHAAIGAFAGATTLTDLPSSVSAVARDGMTMPHPCTHEGGYVIIPLRTRNGDRGCIVVEAASLPKEALEPCEIYAQQIVQALENVVLYERATVDQLTHVYTRDFGIRRLQETLRLGSRTADVTSAIMIDIDRFKPINDTFGHAAGDLALRSVAKAVQEACRTTDIVARYGGEEFLVVLPATASEGANVVAERIRTKIAGLAVEFEGNVLQLTASLGVATANSGDNDDAALLRNADAAMYRAKAGGRNAVTSWSPEQNSTGQTS